MNTVLLVAHAPLAHSMRLAGLHVFVDLQAYIATVDVLPNATPEDSQAEVLQAWHALQTEGPKTTGTLILVDVYGATPCNVAMQALQGADNTRWLAGFNLPMFLKVLNKLHLPLDQLVEKAQVGGVRGIYMPPDCKGSFGQEQKTAHAQLQETL